MIFEKKSQAGESLVLFGSKIDRRVNGGRNLFLIILPNFCSNFRHSLLCGERSTE